MSVSVSGCLCIVCSLSRVIAFACVYLFPSLGSCIANKLHLFGDDKEEQKKMSAANTLAAGLPLPEDVMSHQEQLLLLGLAKDNEEAEAMLKRAGAQVALSNAAAGGGERREAPTLYTAPDPNEDPEAKRAMEELAVLALQVQNVIASGTAVHACTDD